MHFEFAIFASSYGNEHQFVDEIRYYDHPWFRQPIYFFALQRGSHKFTIFCQSKIDYVDWSYPLVIFNAILCIATQTTFILAPFWISKGENHGSSLINDNLIKVEKLPTVSSIDVDERYYPPNISEMHAKFIALINNHHFRNELCSNLPKRNLQITKLNKRPWLLRNQRYSFRTQRPSIIHFPVI